MALSTISGTTGITDATITSAKLADFAAAVDLNGVELILDADQDTSITADTDDRIDFKLGGVEHISINNSSGDTVIKPMVDGKDIVFQQYDGNKILEINDGNYVAISGAAAGPGELRFYEDTDLGSHYTGFKAGNATASISYVLPLADGSSGQHLSTDGSGTLSWSTPSANTPSSADGQALGSASLEWSDLFLADSSVIYFGADQDTTLTHTDGSGLTLNSTNKLMFGDTGTYIFQSADGVLDLVSDTEIELNATTLDINANVEISGTATTTGVHTFTAVPVFPNDTVETADIQDNAVSLAKMAGLARGKIIYGDSSGNPAALTVGSNGQGLVSDGTDISWGSAGVSTLAALTDVSMDITNFVDGLLIQPNSDGSAPTTGTLSTATGNVGIGKTTFGALTSGDYNTAIGYNAMPVHTTGGNNVAIGKDALESSTTGGANVAVGLDALADLTTGTGNVAVGANALDAQTTAVNNTAVGYLAAYQNTTGTLNVAMGYNALGLGTTSTYCVAIGGQALYNNTTAHNNVAVGYQSMLANTEGYANTAIGNHSFKVNTTGDDNTALGYNALGVATTADDNTAVGHQTMNATTTGHSNTAVGKDALSANTTGYSTVAVGFNSMGGQTTGAKNVAVGQHSLNSLTTALETTSIGHESLLGVTTGSFNTGIGKGAGEGVTTGTYNTFLGHRAGNNVTTADNCIIIGSMAATLDAPTSATADNQINIGNAFQMHGNGDIILNPGAEIQNTWTFQQGRTMLSYQDANNWGMIMNEGANTGANYYIGFKKQDNSWIGSIGGNSSNVAYNTSSDYRLKENVTYTWDATTRLKQLKPARFNWIIDDTNTLEDGFIAHEVDAVVPAAVTGVKDAMQAEVLYKESDAEVINGTKNVGDVRHPETIDAQSMDYSKLVTLLVKTVQELEARITALE